MKCKIWRHSSKDAHEEFHGLIKNMKGKIESIWALGSRDSVRREGGESRRDEIMNKKKMKSFNRMKNINVSPV